MYEADLGTGYLQLTYCGRFDRRSWRSSIHGLRLCPRILYSGLKGLRRYLGSRLGQDERGLFKHHACVCRKSRDLVRAQISASQTKPRLRDGFGEATICSFDTTGS